VRAAAGGSDCGLIIDLALAVVETVQEIVQAKGYWERSGFAEVRSALGIARDAVATICLRTERPAFNGRDLLPWWIYDDWADVYEETLRKIMSFAQIKESSRERGVHHEWATALICLSVSSGIFPLLADPYVRQSAGRYGAWTGFVPRNPDPVTRSAAKDAACAQVWLRVSPSLTTAAEALAQR
jgi:hypothetical protein